LVEYGRKIGAESKTKAVAEEGRGGMTREEPVGVAKRALRKGTKGRTAQHIGNTKVLRVI